ncbi:MAG: DinB family protein [Actinomycetota bacterium]
MTVQRRDPPLQATERAVLDSWLEYHRATLAQKCDGLTDNQLRERSVPPSSMSPLGLVRHMAEVERNWFRRVLAGEDAPPRTYTRDNPDGDFDDVDSADVDEGFAFWRDECEHAREVAAKMALDDVGAKKRDDNPISLRWVLVHMIEEYARHNGHADLLRERIDGATGD